MGLLGPGLHHGQRPAMGPTVPQKDEDAGVRWLPPCGPYVGTRLGHLRYLDLPNGSDGELHRPR